MTTIHFIILISIFIVFFLVIWGLTYLSHNTSVKIVSWLILSTSSLLLFMSVFWVVADVLNVPQNRVWGLNLEGMSNTMGTFAFLWGLAAVFIFFLKPLFRRLHINRTNGRDVVRRILLLAKSHHNLFGWVTLVAATSHGIYFLFHEPNSWFEFYSGVGAWLALVLLAISGMWMTKGVKTPKRVKFMRLTHIGLTIGYAGAIVLHFRGSLFISIFLFAAAFIALGIIFGLTRLTPSFKNK